MKCLALVSHTERATVAIPVEVFDPRLNDLQIDDGSGGYRYVRPSDTAGKILVRYESKVARQAGIQQIGIPAYCTRLQS